VSRLSFSDRLAVFALIVTIILLVLDKAEKLKGTLLIWLLAFCAVLALPMLFSMSPVSDAPTTLAVVFRRILATSLLVAVWASVVLWIQPDQKPVAAELAKTAGTLASEDAQTPTKTGAKSPQPDDRKTDHPASTPTPTSSVAAAPKRQEPPAKPILIPSLDVLYDPQASAFNFFNRGSTNIYLWSSDYGQDPNLKQEDMPSTSATITPNGGSYHINASQFADQLRTLAAPGTPVDIRVPYRVYITMDDGRQRILTYGLWIHGAGSPLTVDTQNQGTQFKRFSRNNPPESKQRAGQGGAGGKANAAHAGEQWVVPAARAAQDQLVGLAATVATLVLRGQVR